MPDFDAIAAALANRYTAAAITAAGGPPAGGYDNVRVSTADVPGQMVPLPAVLVFPEEGAFRTGNGTRQGEHDFTVRFYYNQTGDPVRDSVALRKWATFLVDQLRLASQLGGIVTVARTMSWRIGIFSYAGADYSGLELTVRIVTDEPWSAVS